MRIEDEVLIGAEHPVVLSAHAPEEVYEIPLRYNSLHNNLLPQPDTVLDFSNDNNLFRWFLLRSCYVDGMVHFSIP
jgi:hypothetical protein